MNKRENKLPYPDRFKQQVYGFANFTPLITFHHTILERWILDDIHGLCDDLPRLKEYSRQCFDYQWDNNPFCLINGGGDIFKFSLTPGRIYSGNLYYSFNVWDRMGATSIGKCQLVGDREPDQKAYRLLVRKTEQFTDGIVHCSHCEKEMSFLESRHRRYFAGIYCDYCWATTYKEIEARENYD